MPVEPIRYRLLGDEEWVETLERQLAHLAPGAHLCPIYDTPEEHFHALTPFLRVGIERGEMCVYIGDNSGVDDLVNRGIATQDDIRRGALVVLPERETYTRGDGFDPEHMFDRWREFVSAAHDGGFAGLRVCGWATWAIDTNIDFARFIQYEAQLSGFLAETGSRVMCHYLFSRFQPTILRDVLRTHPLAVLGDHVHENMYYEPPSIVLGSPRTDRKRVDWMRGRLRARARRDVALANLGRLALAGAAPAELFDPIAQFIAAEYEVDLVEVTELQPDRAALRVVALGGRLMVEPGGGDRRIGADASIGDGALQPDGPLVVTDWSTEPRFRPLLPDTSPPIVSSASVVIGLPEGQPVFGFLSVHSTRPRIFAEDEVVLLENVALALAHALDRKRREDEFRALAEHSPDAIVRVDPRLRIQYVNPEFERLTGRTADALVGQPVDTHGLLQPMFATWNMLLHQVLRTGRDQTEEYTLQSQSGMRVLQGRIVPEFSPATGREVLALLIVARDVSELAHAVTERERLSGELLERERRHQERLERLVSATQEENRRLREASVLQQLSSRERDILKLVALGRTNAAIGAELHLSPGTVKNHITHLLRKLGAADRAQAAAKAGEIGLTDTPG